MWKIFCDFVRHHFRYLETEFGFVLRSSKLPFMIYESDKLEVNVYYDVHGRKEIDLEIRKRRSSPREAYGIGIGTLMRLRNGKDTQGYEESYPTSEAALNVEVERLAGLLREYGESLLSGDLHDFERMEQWNREAAKKNGVQG